MPHSALKTLPLGRNLPLDMGPIHFVGIGGIGMSGIAEILHNLGYTVQGSDMAESPNTERLRGLGIRIFIGHDGVHVHDASAVVISSAVKADNPEVIAAREQRLPVVRRAEMLAELTRLKMTIAVAGTHGKTTTTAMTASLLEGAGLKPTVINGGILNTHGTNAYLGEGEWMVVEADESDGTFTKLPATIGIITNIDPEHLEHYGSFDGLKAAFHTFVTNLPFYGFVVACMDHPEVQALISRITDRRVITYGTAKQADICARNVRAESKGQRFDVVLAETPTREETTLPDMFLPMHGEHNMRNALAAIAVALELGMKAELVARTLETFGGVKRRFTHVGEAHGVQVIDDYGHHPVEIKATLKAARSAQAESGGRVIAVIQPHRYSRLNDLFEEFCTCANDADIVVVTDVYTAGEAPIEGRDGDALVEGLKRAGHRQVVKLSSENALAATLRELAEAGDMVVCLGAGSISKWAGRLPAELEALA